MDCAVAHGAACVPRMNSTELEPRYAGRIIQKPHANEDASPNKACVHDLRSILPGTPVWTAGRQTTPY